MACESDETRSANWPTGGDFDHWTLLTTLI